MYFAAEMVSIDTGAGYRTMGNHIQLVKAVGHRALTMFDRAHEGGIVNCKRASYFTGHWLRRCVISCAEGLS